MFSMVKLVTTLIGLIHILKLNLEQICFEHLITTLFSAVFIILALPVNVFFKYNNR